MLYVQLKKSLYGTLQALLFWKILSETLQEWGFKLNPYDKCADNKNINGKQCIIIWLVGLGLEWMLASRAKSPT